jgi:hypothetical protein
MMDKKTITALVHAGAVKKVKIIADGAFVHVDILTAGGSSTATTLKGSIKTWSNIDAAARWIRALGLGTAQLELSRWSPGQKGFSLES